MRTEEIEKELFRSRDEQYRAFQSPLLPSVDPRRMIGVRTPALRALSKRILSDGSADTFLSELPHRYFEEDQLHAFLLSSIKDFDRCLRELDRFLPFVDNWATCDQTSPVSFGKHRAELLPAVRRWLESGETYAVRFAVKVLMDHFLDDAFNPAYLERVASIRSEEYYVKMMIAWFFATALAKRYDEALPFLAERRLPPWIHNKTIRKAIESRRISAEQKAFLRTLTI
ncbi:MAG: DNA alkylation repair protein, partial [Clostridia bacterium]|nr:DNA alkylation repair protein [Clostridia bacterium]